MSRFKPAETPLFDCWTRGFAAVERHSQHLFTDLGPIDHFVRHVVTRGWRSEQCLQNTLVYGDGRAWLPFLALRRLACSYDAGESVDDKLIFVKL